MKTAITVKHANGIHFSSDNGSEPNDHLVTSLCVACMNLGFVMTKQLYDRFLTSSPEEIKTVGASMIAELKRLKGDDVEYNAMYPNFPAQVMEMEEYELYINALVHYWTAGRWQPDSVKEAREFAIERSEFIELVLLDDKQYKEIFSKIVSSNDSISATDKKTVLWFLENETGLGCSNVPHKETLSLIAGFFLDKGVDISHLCKNSTDVLRVITALSGGDVSLAENTKFKSLPRKTRKALTKTLEKVASVDDLFRHKNKWIKAAHSLHVGDYSDTVFKMMSQLRDKKTVQTFNGKVEAAIGRKDIAGASRLLSEKPGEFARRLDLMLRTRASNTAVDEFSGIVDKVSTRVLCQVIGHFNVRNEQDYRIIFPKGNTQRGIKLLTTHKISDKLVSKVLDACNKSLSDRFAQLPPLGKVKLDESLKSCPLPTQQRSASEGLIQVARGTHLDIGDKDTLRFFMYWIGQDIDLSASIHDENFNLISQIAYYDLKDDYGCHSGDITHAPFGASEFIDLNLSSLADTQRYIVMNLNVYSGPNFADHEKCHVGWMTRDKPKSNEIFEPATVEQRIDLVGQSRRSVPVVFDIKERKAIWTDLYGTANWSRGGNNVASNAASIEETLSYITNPKIKYNLYDLFKLHAEARGTIVTEDADVTFGFGGDVGPADIAEINSSFLV